MRNVFGNISVAVFSDIADALQSAGMAVLTYDKRTCTGSSMETCYNNAYPTFTMENATAADFIQDALAAVRYLSKRKDVGEITVVGHSQGGSYIPILLEAEPAIITKGVVLAAAFRGFDELAQWQREFTQNLVKLFNVDNATACLGGVSDEMFDQFVQWLKAVKADSPVPDIPEFDLYAAYWKELFNVQSRTLSAAKALRQPLLIVHGDTDWVGPPSEAADWSDYLTEAGVTHEVTILPCVTHFMNCIKTFPYDIGDSVDEKVIDSLINFIAEDSPKTASQSAFGRSDVSRTGVASVFMPLVALLVFGAIL